jgi:hypothetical protein
MTWLWPEGEAVEAIHHPQCGNVAHGVRPAEPPISDWRTSSPNRCTPLGFVWQGTSYYILVVCNHWRVHTRWWESDQALWRQYLKVLVAPVAMADILAHSYNPGSASGGFLGLLYCDLRLGDWFLARVYD